MQEYRNPFQGIGTFFRSGSPLSILLIVNIAIWLLIAFIRVPLFLSRAPEGAVTEFVIQFLALPAMPRSLLIHPWTIITYMFLHIDFFHILFNMLWLFWFGRIFTEYLSNRKLVITYILGGIAGGLLYMFFYNVFPVFEDQRNVSFALGASASVMAIVSAISFYAPNYSVYFIFIGKIRIIYIFVVLFILDFFMIRSGNSGGHIAHIGGALFGILYATIIRNGYNLKELTDVFRQGRFRRVKTFDPSGGRWTRKKKEPPVRTMNDDEYNLMKAEKQKKIDNILDKIKKSGYDSLTKAEKEFLFKESQK
jgi:membrane associated rhomboid family serine protease